MTLIRNPWQAGARADECGLAVDFEYAGHTTEPPETCGLCQQPQGFYRASVGAIQCANCRALLIVRVNPTTRQVTETWTPLRSLS